MHENIPRYLEWTYCELFINDMCSMYVQYIFIIYYIYCTIQYVYIYIQIFTNIHKSLYIHKHRNHFTNPRKKKKNIIASSSFISVFQSPSNTVAWIIGVRGVNPKVQKPWFADLKLQFTSSPYTVEDSLKLLGAWVSSLFPCRWREWNPERSIMICSWS